MTKRSKQPTPAEIRRVFRALPRTADGRVIVPGSRLWNESVRIVHVLSIGRKYVTFYVPATNTHDASIPPEPNTLFALRANAVREAKRRTT